VILNEFLFDADGVDAGNEFVELYNATDQAVDLTGWSLQVQSGAAGTIKKKNFDDGLSIAANGCFLAWLGSPPADARPQFVWSSGTLNNTAATIYVSGGTDAVQSDSDAQVVDSISYVAETIPGFAAGMSAERVGETQDVRARQAPSPNSCVRLADDEPVPTGGALTREEKSNAPFAAPAITFYKNPAGVGSRIDVAWGAYPFIPLINQGEASWGAIAFYLNHAPDGKQYLSTIDRQSTGSEYALRMQYPIIRGGTFPWENLLVLPDTRGNMTTDNGLFSDAYNYDRLTADSAAYATTDVEGKKGDYLTVGYYRFSSAGGGSQNLDLIYADPKKIYFK
ncbi:MAG: lamin tail domain-containing protein, partial [bacterium]|nr:lamin tail domain-containing protein [bacterium]